MATKYPSEIDNNKSIPKAKDLNTQVNALIFNNIRSAVISLETELGINPSDGYDTVAERLNVLEPLCLTCSNSSATNYPNIPNSNENGYVAIANNGNFRYLGGTSNDQVLSWNETSQQWEATTIDSELIISPILTSNVDNYSPTNWTNASVVRLSSTSEVTISGAVIGIKKTIFNIGNYNIILLKDSGNSFSNNRLLFVENDFLIIPPNGSAVFLYDSSSSRWRVIQNINYLPTDNIVYPLTYNEEDYLTQYTLSVQNDNYPVLGDGFEGDGYRNALNIIDSLPSYFYNYQSPLTISANIDIEATNENQYLNLANTGLMNISNYYNDNKLGFGVAANYSNSYVSFYYKNYIKLVPWPWVFESKLPEWQTNSDFYSFAFEDSNTILICGNGPIYGTANTGNFCYRFQLNEQTITGVFTFTNLTRNPSFDEEGRLWFLDTVTSNIFRVNYNESFNSGVASIDLTYNISNIVGATCFDWYTIDNNNYLIVNRSSTSSIIYAINKNIIINNRTFLLGQEYVNKNLFQSYSLDRIDTLSIKIINNIMYIATHSQNVANTQRLYFCYIDSLFKSKSSLIAHAKIGQPSTYCRGIDVQPGTDKLFISNGSIGTYGTSVTNNLFSTKLTHHSFNQITLPQTHNGQTISEIKGLEFETEDTLLFIAVYSGVSRCFRYNINTQTIIGYFNFTSNVYNLSKDSNGRIWTFNATNESILRLDLVTSFQTGTAVTDFSFGFSALPGFTVPCYAFCFITVNNINYFAIKASNTCYIINESNIIDGGSYNSGMLIASFDVSFSYGTSMSALGETLFISASSAQRTSTNTGLQFINQYDLGKRIRTGTENFNYSNRFIYVPTYSYISDISFIPNTNTLYAAHDYYNSTFAISKVYPSFIEQENVAQSYTAEYDGYQISIKINNKLFYRFAYTFPNSTYTIPYISIGSNILEPVSTTNKEYSYSKIKNLLLKSGSLSNTEYQYLTDGYYENNSYTKHLLYNRQNDSINIGSLDNWIIEDGYPYLRPISERYGLVNGMFMDNNSASYNNNFYGKINPGLFKIAMPQFSPFKIRQTFSLFDLFNEQGYQIDGYESYIVLDWLEVSDSLSLACMGVAFRDVNEQIIQEYYQEYPYSYTVAHNYKKLTEELPVGTRFIDIIIKQGSSNTETSIIPLTSYIYRKPRKITVTDQTLVIPLQYDRRDYSDVLAMTEYADEQDVNISDNGFEGNDYTNRLEYSNLPSWASTVGQPISIHAITKAEFQYQGHPGELIAGLNYSTGSVNFGLYTQEFEGGLGQGNFIHSVRFNSTDYIICQSKHKFKGPFPQIDGYTFYPRAIEFVNQHELLLIGIDSSYTFSRCFKVWYDNYEVDKNFQILDWFDFISPYQEITQISRDMDGYFWATPCRHYAASHSTTPRVLFRLNLEQSFIDKIANITLTYSFPNDESVSFTWVTHNSIKYMLMGLNSGSGGYSRFPLLRLDNITDGGVFNRGSSPDKTCLTTITNYPAGMVIKDGYFYSSYEGSYGCHKFSLENFLNATNGQNITPSGVSITSAARYVSSIAKNPYTNQIWSVSYSGDYALENNPDRGWRAVWAGDFGEDTLEHNITAYYDGYTNLQVKLDNVLFTNITVATLSQRATINRILVGGAIRPDGFGESRHSGYIRNVMVKNGPVTKEEYSLLTAGAYEKNRVQKYPLNVNNTDGYMNGWINETGNIYPVNITGNNYSTLIKYKDFRPYCFTSSFSQNSIARFRVDLSTISSPEQLDNYIIDTSGLYIHCQFYQGMVTANAQNRTAGMGFRFLNSSQQTISEVWSPIVSLYTFGNAFKYRRLNRSVPVGTRYIDILMRIDDSLFSSAYSYDIQAIDDINCYIYKR